MIKQYFEIKCKRCDSKNATKLLTAPSTKNNPDVAVLYCTECGLEIVSVLVKTKQSKQPYWKIINTNLDGG